MGSTLGQPDQQFTRHVNDLYPSIERLEAAREAVYDLVTSAGWPHLIALIDAETAGIDRVLDGGRLLGSRSEYAHWHGRRGGLRGAEEAAHALISRAEARLEEQRRRHERDAEPSLTGG